MLSADQGLMATNTAPAAARGSASSPSTHQARKRRHTAVAGSEPAGSPETSVKRVKRTQTYGSKRHRTVLDDEDEEDENIAAMKTSQPARFSEHPGFQSSVELPTGSRTIGNDFVNHEPAVMFRESGSTVEDSPSAQQRQLDQVLRRKDGLTTSHLAVEVEVEKPSSSLGWLASQQTPATNQEGGGDSTDKENATNGDDAGVDQQEGGDTADIPTAQQSESVPDRSNQQPQEAPASGTASAQHNSKHAHKEEESRATPIPQAPTRALHLSPMVEIMTTAPATAQSPPESTSVTKSAKGRRRKSQANNPGSEPLNPDDKAIGLPKERYVPRPSRRRATAALEEPVDYSVAPEKAAKMKRTKTTQAPVKEAAAENPELMKQILNRLGTNDKKEDLKPVDEPQPPPTDLKADKDEPMPDVHTQEAQAEPSQPINEPTPGQENPASQFTVKPKDADHIFAKPAIPTPTAKAASKAKRSQTTIFEDHIEFLGSQRSSPSLSQQQAKRKSALQTTKGETAPGSSRKRRTIVQDHEDDEDELAIIEADEEAQSPRKKRGRGRPAKSTAKPKAKSAGTVADESDGEHQPEPEVEEAPKKAARGRPAKSTAEPKAKSAETVADDEEDEDQPVSEVDEAPKKATRGRPKKGKAAASGKENEPVGSPQAEEYAQPAKDAEPLVSSTTNAQLQTPQKPQPSTQELPTPSPEKAAGKAAEKPTEKATENAASTTQKVSKGSPTAHTPLKGSSTVPLRVGLSKRSRIPPLLRMMKPPKK